MGAEIQTSESKIMPQIISLLLNSQNDQIIALFAHPKLQYAIILVVGRYSSWIAEHKEFIPAALCISL